MKISTFHPNIISKKEHHQYTQETQENITSVLVVFLGRDEIWIKN
jgi:hypothetical protein